MHLIVGLGNPGQEYSFNRHNIGFIVLDRIASEYKACAFKQNNSGLVTSAELGQSKVILLKPTTYMNLSGSAVLSISSFYKIPMKNTLIIHDDIDLQFNAIKLKFGGGHGGHNGLRDITSHIGSDYWRLRIGIGRPKDNKDVAHYVLSDFSDSEKTSIEYTIDRIAQNISSFVVSDDKQKFISQLI